MWLFSNHANGVGKRRLLTSQWAGDERIPSALPINSQLFITERYWSTAFTTLPLEICCGREFLPELGVNLLTKKSCDELDIAVHALVKIFFGQPASAQLLFVDSHRACHVAYEEDQPHQAPPGAGQLC